MMDFITTNILRNPPVLLGLIAMLGLILQKKAIYGNCKRNSSCGIWYVNFKCGRGYAGKFHIAD